MSSESSLASVVTFIPDFVEKWVRLDDQEPLAKLHSKFWGTSMEKKEACRAKESATSAHDGIEGDEDEDEEFIPGCYALEIDNDGINKKIIWVRFVRIFNYLVTYYDKKTNEEGYTPSVVITGQPGIGKNTFINYALRRCLEERRPVIFRNQFLFVEDGVYLMGAHLDLVCFKKAIWTLVGSDESQTGVPTTFVRHGTPSYTLHLQRPDAGSLSKRNAVIVMNPWSRREIHQAAKLSSVTLDSNLVNDTYDRLGPTPRLCIEMASDPRALAAHEETVNIALEALTLPQRLQESMIKFQKPRMDIDDASHELCLIKRQNIDDVWSSPSVMPITDYIRSRIATQMRKASSVQQIDLYRMFAAMPSRVTTGPIFELFCRVIFEKRISIDINPIIWLAGHDQPKGHWDTSHHPVEDQNLENLHQNALGRKVTLNIWPSDVCEYNEQDIQELTPTPDVYYIPSTQNAVVVDSFIYHGGYLNLFQFPGSDVDKIITSRLTQCAKFPPRSKWRIILIFPDDYEVLTYPSSRGHELRTTKLFSSKVKMENYLEVGRFEEQEEAELEESPRPPHKKRKTIESPVEEAMVVDKDGEGFKQ